MLKLISSGRSSFESPSTRLEKNKKFVKFVNQSDTHAIVHRIQWHSQITISTISQYFCCHFATFYLNVPKPIWKSFKLEFSIRESRKSRWSSNSVGPTPMSTFLGCFYLKFSDCWETCCSFSVTKSSSCSAIFRLLWISKKIKHFCRGLESVYFETLMICFWSIFILFYNEPTDHRGLKRNSVATRYYPINTVHLEFLIQNSRKYSPNWWLLKSTQTLANGSI